MMGVIHMQTGRIQRNTMDNCDGCRLHGIDYYDQITCLPHNKDGSCPCSFCLVKIMCDDFCDKADDWWNNIERLNNNG
jgi:hypothetical protein